MDLFYKKSKGCIGYHNISSQLLQAKENLKNTSIFVHHKILSNYHLLLDNGGTTHFIDF